MITITRKSMFSKHARRTEIPYMNTSKIEEILQNFYEISGMDIAVLNSKNKILARRYSGALYCSCIHKSQSCLDMCVESDKCGMTKAKDTGGLVIYKCPFGIHEAIMPIKKNDYVVGYLFLGMGVEDLEESKNELYTNALNVSPTLNKKMLEKSISSMPNYSKEKLHAYASLLPMIAEYIESNNLLTDDDMSIGQLVKGYVKNNLSKKITLSDISWHLHCSTVTLTEHFKKEYGITIMEYVMKKKMQRAEQLLINSDMSIREVSEACGFPSIEYFSRSFKKHSGLSPYAWRCEHTISEKSKTRT